MHRIARQKRCTSIVHRKLTKVDCSDNCGNIYVPGRAGPVFSLFRLPHKCKKASFSRTAAHIFVSPGDAPGAITLNVIWMEREFDAYKLPRWMCPSSYNRFSDRAIYWSKIVIFSYSLAFDAPVRGVPVGTSPPRLVQKN